MSPVKIIKININTQQEKRIFHNRKNKFLQNEKSSPNPQN